jgi:hypothetical protein
MTANGKFAVIFGRENIGHEGRVEQFKIIYEANRYDSNNNESILCGSWDYCWQ